MSKIGLAARRAGIRALLASPLRGLFLDAPFMFTPQQLFCLCTLAREAAAQEGCFYEIGCAYANTTLFLNRYLAGEGIEVDYRVIDTFAGFTGEDVAHEVDERGTPDLIRHSFNLNDRRWIERKLARNGLGRIPCIESDATLVDFAAGPPVAFALLDVDLYRPTAIVLPKLWERLVPGGVIVIDDCDPAHEVWNGAHQAYREFMATQGLEMDIRHGKLGILARPAAGA